MTDYNGETKVASLEVITDSTRHGTAIRALDILKRNLETSAPGISYSRPNEGDHKIIDVYCTALSDKAADPVVVHTNLVRLYNALREFERTDGGGGKVKVSTRLTIYPLGNTSELNEYKDANAELTVEKDKFKKQYGESQQEVKKIEADNANKDEQIEDKDKELGRKGRKITSLERRLKKAKGKLSSKGISTISYEDSATPENLADVLDINRAVYEDHDQKCRTDYVSNEEKLIDEVFYEASEEINTRRLFSDNQLDKALNLITRGENYEENLKSLDNLPLTPEEIKKIKEDTKQKAEENLRWARELEGAYNNTKEYKVLVRIAKDEDQLRIVLPVDAKSDNEVVKALYQSLINSLRGLKAKDDSVSYSEIKDVPYTSFQVSGISDYDMLKAAITKGLENVAKEAMLTINTFYTDFYDGSVAEAQAQLESLDEFVDYRIKQVLTKPGTEEHYKGRTEFLKIKGFNLSTTLSRINNGKKIRATTMQKMADALGVDVSELEKRLPTSKTS